MLLARLQPYTGTEEREMTLRYFKATDGQITVFRASATRAYASAWFTTEGNRPIGDIGFSGKPLPLGKYPAVEITKAEYEALQAAKVERVKAAGENLKWATSPQSSWVRNADLTEATQS
jgi:hypothetical protein